METKQSLLKLSSIPITPRLRVKIPTVGEILECEQHYYHMVSSMTAVPCQYMVPLAEMGIDYTILSEYELFMMLLPMYSSSDLSLILDDISDGSFCVRLNEQNGNKVLYNAKCDIIIDELIYEALAAAIRSIHSFEKVTTMPGNEEAKRYLLEKEKKRQKRNALKPYEPYLEKLVIALVNRQEFKYDYDTVMDLSIYKFNQSLKQIQTNINFQNIMHGIYAGTIDTAKLHDKSCLSWIPKN